MNGNYSGYHSNQTESVIKDRYQESTKCASNQDSAIINNLGLQESKLNGTLSCKIHAAELKISKTYSSWYFFSYVERKRVWNVRENVHLNW